MSSAATTSLEAEANVTLARADLSATLDQLRDNLRPAHLVTEVMARPRNALGHGIAVYGQFAKHSPVSKLIIGAAGLLIARSLIRREG